MNGILVVNKPKDFTSRDVVNKLNKVFGTKKMGHTGTLDPIATGVLVVAIGSYTKLVNELTSLDKEYIAEIKLGIKTDTGDITGNVLEENNNYNITKDDIENVLSNFPKEYQQTVPKYSAVKINGKKLYEYARENIDVDLPKRLVNIYSIELIEFNNDIIKFKTHVSKGTYIRSLIEDICEKLNILGTMNSLQRTKQGIFSLDDSYNLEDVNKDVKLLSSRDIFDVTDHIVSEDEYKKVINGNKVDFKEEFGLFNMIYDNKDIALYKVDNYIGKLVMFYK